MKNRAVQLLPSVTTLENTKLVAELFAVRIQ